MAQGESRRPRGGSSRRSQGSLETCSHFHHNGCVERCAVTASACVRPTGSATMGSIPAPLRKSQPTLSRRLMVERKIRPAPLTLVARKPVKPAVKAGPTPRLATAQKLFVLDTNVLMHDPTSLFRFEEHDIYLPMLTLEELDNNKKGVTEVARNARQASRFLDELVSTMTENIGEGIPLEAKSGGAATGRLYLQTDGITTVLPASLANGKADNQILAVVMHLQHLHVKRNVVLVTKDINMRIKARALGIAAEDYFNDKVLEDTELLYSGMRELPGDFWDKHGKGMESWQQGGNTYYRVTGPLIPSLLVNEFLYHEKPGEAPLHALVKEIT